jgi:tetratricopeptide (TPR) repeat protein
MLGDRVRRSQWAAKAVQCDPLSPFVRGLAGMCHYITRDYDDALRLYDEGLAMDPNSVICLWQSGMTLDRLGRLDDELERFNRAVDLSRRGVLMLSFQYRALFKLGRVDEANAIVDDVRARANTEYIADSFWLGPALLGGDEDDTEAALRLNIAAGTGPTTLSISVDRELEALLPHPRLGPLVRQLSLYAQ